jgi:hypothetical protein
VGRKDEQVESVLLTVDLELRPKLAAPINLNGFHGEGETLRQQW